MEVFVGECFAEKEGEYCEVEKVYSRCSAGTKFKRSDVVLDETNANKDPRQIMSAAWFCE
jgi:hypothetical protein